MSPAAAFHTQLASIMEVLANTAVAEICELVDSGYSVLQLEISRSRKENEVLRRKLRLMELRAARATALRAAATASGTALRAANTASGTALRGANTASGTALRAANTASGSTALLRAQLPPHHPGGGTRRTGAPAGEAVRPAASNQEPLRRGDPAPSSEPGRDAAQGAPPAGAPPAATIKVEEDDESWSRSEQDEDFCRASDGQVAETEAPPPLTKQEVAEEGDGASRPWLSAEVGSPPASVPTAPRQDAGGYECLMYEPALQHGSLTTQNPLGEDPGCSYVLNTSVTVADSSGGSGGFPFAVSEASLSSAELQQRAPPADEPQPPVRKETAERLGAFSRRERWRAQDGGGREDGGGGGGGKSFVCNCCGKTLACLKNLKTHMRVHTGEKPFVCALCGKRFSDSSNLKRHQSVHTGEKRYGCVHCGKRFAQSGSLKVHMTVHTDCKQFRCWYCGKTFISGSHLRRHITVHGGEKRFAPTLQ